MTLYINLTTLLQLLATGILSFLGGLACRSLRFTFTLTTEDDL